MAGQRVKYRHLSRDSAHRKALLRNLITSLFKHGNITTTWPKAKEAQRLAEKVVTMAKKNTNASLRRAHEIFYTPGIIPPIFKVLRERYAEREGGYTRILRVEPKKDDQAPSAILELVDGKKDMRFTLTAQTVARDLMLEQEHHETTLRNVEKVTRFRKNGKEEFEKQVQDFIRMEREGVRGKSDPDRKVNARPRMRLRGDESFPNKTKEEERGPRDEDDVELHFLQT